MIEDFLDKASDLDWKWALDEEIRNHQEFTEWLWSDTNADTSNIARFIMWYVTGRVIKPEDFDQRDLLWIVMCEEPEIANRARMLLREKYMNHQIDSVTERVAHMNGWEH